MGVQSIFLKDFFWVEACVQRGFLQHTLQHNYTDEGDLGDTMRHCVDADPLTFRPHKLIQPPLLPTACWEMPRPLSPQLLDPH